jgi:membrane-bound lytic murein transglycosylase C
METESYFNPTAKSPVPAFGLMQLVPATGARDAYKYLYSKDVVVKDTYLYNAENNIELGVAYLHILYYRYLKRIKDPTARQWATIAAYNTGVHNVVKSFSGEYTKAKYASRWSWKRQAINKINKMKPEQVYQHLRHYLPYEETRTYIKKVRDSMPKYIT